MLVNHRVAIAGHRFDVGPLHVWLHTCITHIVSLSLPSLHCPQDFENGAAIQLDCLCKGEVAMRHRACAIEWSIVSDGSSCPASGMSKIPIADAMCVLMMRLLAGQLARTFAWLLQNHVVITDMQ